MAAPRYGRNPLRGPGSTSARRTENCPCDLPARMDQLECGAPRGCGSEPHPTRSADTKRRMAPPGDVVDARSQQDPDLIGGPWRHSTPKMLPTVTMGIRSSYGDSTRAPANAVGGSVRWQRSPRLQDWNGCRGEGGPLRQGAPPGELVEIFRISRPRRFSPCPSLVGVGRTSTCWVCCPRDIQFAEPRCKPESGTSRLPERRATIASVEYQIRRCALERAGLKGIGLQRVDDAAAALAGPLYSPDVGYQGAGRVQTFRTVPHHPGEDDQAMARVRCPSVRRPIIIHFMPLRLAQSAIDGCRLEVKARPLSNYSTQG